MGLIHADLSLRNPRDPGLAPLEVRALVDTGSLHLCVPEHVALQLRLEAVSEREVTIADGGKRLCPYVGPLEVHFDGRACFTGALVLGDEVLLGAVPMEDMDLVVDPARQRVTVNPESPNIPSSTAKAGDERGMRHCRSAEAKDWERPLEAPSGRPAEDLKAILLEMPDLGEDEDFARRRGADLSSRVVSFARRQLRL